MEGNEKERTLYTGRTQVGLKLESRQAVIARYSISRSILVEKKKQEALQAVPPTRDLNVCSLNLFSQHKCHAQCRTGLVRRSWKANDRTSLRELFQLSA